MNNFVTGQSIKYMSQDEMKNVYGADVGTDGLGEVIISMSKLASISQWYCVSGSAVITASLGLYSYVKKCL